MKLNFENFKNNSIIEIAKSIALAAKTAPKARGRDTLEIIIVTNDEIKQISEKMIFISERDGKSFFKRDAENILQASAIILIGTTYKSLGLDCGWCGYSSCNEKDKNISSPCIFNLNDLGIAIGSIVSLAADYRIDNRVMFSIGKAAIELNFFSDDIKAAFGIPLSATNKNPFFDRKPI